MRLRTPEPGELEDLSELCLRSKAHWGYPPEMVEAFREELTIAPAELLEDSFLLAEDDWGIAGIVQVSLQGEDATLEKLFVEPERMGEGIGTRLFEWACDTARARGACRLLIDSDPGAVPFYERMRAVLAGESPSGSIPGRMLPRLVRSLTPAVAGALRS